MEWQSLAEATEVVCVIELLYKWEILNLINRSMDILVGFKLLDQRHYLHLNGYNLVNVNKV
jgi:hypothetical protein